MQTSALVIMYALVTTLRALCPSCRWLRHLMSQAMSHVHRVRRHVALVVACCARALRSRVRPFRGSATRQTDGHHLAVAASRTKDRPLAAMPEDS